jgi:hypothetical protein
MTRNWKTPLLIFLRKLGLLCRKPQPPKPGLRIGSTVYPKDSIPMVKWMADDYLQRKKDSYKLCKFDVENRTCECGVSLEKFGEKGCNNRTKKQLILG